MLGRACMRRKKRCKGFATSGRVAARGRGEGKWGLVVVSVVAACGIVKTMRARNVIIYLFILVKFFFK